MTRRRLIIAVLLLLLLPAVLLSWLTLTENGLRWAWHQAEAFIPGEITLNTLSGKLIGPITLDGIEYRQDGTLIKAERILIDWQPTALLAASVNISRVHIQALEISLPETEATEQPTTQPLILPEISLPWHTLLRNADIDGLRISRQGQSFDLEHIRLDATTLFSKVDIEQLHIKGDTFSLDIKGELRPARSYRHDLSIDWKAELPSSAVINGTGQLTGNLQKTHLNQRLNGPLQLSLDADVMDALDRLNWRAKVDVTQFDTSKLDAGLPALSGALKLDASGDLDTATVTGALKGQYPELGALNADFNVQRLSDNSLRIDRLELHAPDTDTLVETSGTWKPASNGGDVKLSLNWRNLRWPVKQTPWFSSASGDGTIEGNIDHYQIQLNSDSPWPEMAPSTWHANADGNASGMNIKSLRVDALDGEAVAAGRLDWSPALRWKAEISAADINPASRWPDWPGLLKAKLTTNGGIENGELVANADITNVSGKLRGYPVSLRSRGAWRDDGLDVALLDLRSGESRISASGRIADTLKLDWSITAPDLADLYPDAKGQLHASGELTGPRDTPMVEASFSGKTLRMQDYEIGAIDGAAAVDLLRWQRIEIRLAAFALNIQGQTLQSLNIDANTRVLSLKAESSEANVQIRLRGKADSQGWRGRIEQADINSTRFTNWTLKAPVALNISNASVTMDRLCWQNGEQARLCASLAKQADIWQSHVNMSKLPLHLFSTWLPPDLILDGVTDASAKLRLQLPDQLSGQAHIELPAGAVSYPLIEGERERWEYHGGKIELTLDQQALKLSFDFAMSNGDKFQGWASLPGVNLLALQADTQPLQASAHLNIHNPGLIEAIIPEVQDLSGEIEMNFTAAGTLAQPRPSGRASLLNGALRIPRLGLTISELNIKSRSDGLEKLSFNLDARSGDGTLAIQGQTTLNASAGWPTTINIKGDQFQVSNIPEARVEVTPDLHISLQHRSIDIQGNVHIPYAKLQPKDITLAARTSDDAVIIGGQQPAEEKWAIHTRIRLTLGERVHFFGYGFEGRFGGNLLLTDEPGQVTKATGEINIPEGRYRAYGQRLDVEYGRLLYTGGPLTNPGLDLRAVRKVGNVTAGIKVRGSLNQPQLELFSTPAMGQTEALAYLLLGGPIDKASGEEGAMMAQAALALGLSGGDSIARSLGDRFGFDEMRVESNDTGDQASLVVGRYLSPKLYVSYGVGLIESINTLKLRYTISDKWQIKAESGEYPGADILYTIER